MEITIIFQAIFGTVTFTSSVMEAVGRSQQSSVSTITPDPDQAFLTENRRMTGEIIGRIGKVMAVSTKIRSTDLPYKTYTVDFFIDKVRRIVVVDQNRDGTNFLCYYQRLDHEGLKKYTDFGCTGKADKYIVIDTGDKKSKKREPPDSKSFNPVVKEFRDLIGLLAAQPRYLPEIRSRFLPDVQSWQANKKLMTSIVRHTNRGKEDVFFHSGSTAGIKLAFLATHGRYYSDCTVIEFYPSSDQRTYIDPDCDGLFSHYAKGKPPRNFPKRKDGGHGLSKRVHALLVEMDARAKLNSRYKP